MEKTLKGSNDQYGLEQIAATVPLFIPRFSKVEFWCFVAGTRSSPRSRPGVQAAKSRITRIWENARIEIRTNQHTHKLV
jgi:hypothetical protein